MANSKKFKSFLENLSESEKKTFIDKIKEILKNISEWIDEFLSHYNSRSPEAIAMRQVKENFDAALKVWEEMIEEAMTVNQAMKKEGITKLDDSGTSGHKMSAESDVKLSERDYPIDPEIEKKVKYALTNSKSKMHTVSTITPSQNKAINRLIALTNNDLYRGKYTGGKHVISDNAIKHSLAEHGDFLREALRAQLPMTAEDIARHLSALKDDKIPTDVKPSRTKQGNASIITSFEVNGYTLYAEEITKSLGKNSPSDLIGHTMYKAPTLSTAAFYTTSMQTQPKRQSMVLCKYYTMNNSDLSTGKFISDTNERPAKLYFACQNNKPKADLLLSGLIALSSDSTNFTDKSDTIEEGYVVCKKPYYITQNNRVFSNSETDVAECVNKLKKQGYDCFIFDKVVGDNYMVAVVNKAQIVKKEPTALYSDRDYTPTSYELMGENERLSKENEKLKADVERLNERLKLERKITHGNHFNESQLGAVAGHLRNIADSTYSKTELIKDLKEAYSFIAQSEELAWEEVFGKFRSIAEKMCENSKSISMMKIIKLHTQ